MIKKNRLTFRISPVLNYKIDTIIKHKNRLIKNRSEFGTKAMQFYLSYLQNSNSETEIILDSLLKLSQELNVELPEIVKLKEKYAKKKNFGIELRYNKRI